MPYINCIRTWAPAGDRAVARYAGLDGDDGVHEAGVDAVPLGGGGDDVGERPLAGLRGSREEAGGSE